MGDSNMNFENTAYLNEEYPPPILSPEIREVFYQFANMLDIKSFMRLAITSKSMYERCMKDKMIKMKIEDDALVAMVHNNAPYFTLHSSIVSRKNNEEYLNKLRQLKYSMSLKRIVIHGGNMDAGTVTEIRRYLEELGIKSIEKIKIDMNNIDCWPEIVSFIKDYNLKIVLFCSTITEAVFRSSFQWNLEHLFYDRTIPGEVLLELDTSIPEIKLGGIEASADVFTQILWKIQTGTLKMLSVSSYSVKWDNFERVPSDFDDPLPAERPLLIGYDEKRWFLHWDGGVTKCEVKESYAQFSKCKKDELPSILQPNEKIHKALAEKCEERIKCLESHFTSFFDGFTVLNEDHKGPFPEERPLLCKLGTSDFQLTYCLLNEDGSMDVYCWDGSSRYEDNYDLEKEWPEAQDHLPLLKFLVKKRIDRPLKKGSFECQNVEDFRLLFDEYEPLPHDFRGQLPERRPLVFASACVSEEEDEEESDSEDEEEEEKEDYRVILYEDGTLIQYRFEPGGYGEVYVGPCSTWNLPSMMMTSEKLKEIVLNAPLFKELFYRIDHDMFSAAFKGIKTIPFDSFDDLPSERPLIFQKSELLDEEIIDERWFVFKDGVVKKCDWKNGRVTFSRANPREFPPILTKSLVSQFFKGKQVNTDVGFYIDRSILNQCLEDCDVHEYEDSLLGDHPRIFKKTVKNGGCECEEEILHLCLVNENKDVMHITWEDSFLSFYNDPDPDDLPSILKSEVYLEYLFEGSWDAKQFNVQWYGSYEDLVGYIEGHKMLDFNQRRPLPKTRPLFFMDDSPMRRRLGLLPVFWFLRKDNLSIKCEKKDSHVLLTVNPNYGHPPAIYRSS